MTAHAIDDREPPFPWLMVLFAVLVFAALTTAQTVRIANFGAQPFAGWKRTTVDRMPPHVSGQVVSGAYTFAYVVGRPVGLDTHIVDLRVTLAPGQEVAIDLATATAAPWTPAPLPGDPAAFFGGMPSIAGTPMAFVSLRGDGAGYTAHLRARTGPMLHTDLWVTWWPGQAWCHGEVMVTASNPAIPDMAAIVPPTLDPRFGDAYVDVPGGFGPLLAPGTVFADGQARALPVTFLWVSQLKSLGELHSWAVAKDCGVGAVGIAQLLADGNPESPASFAPRAWAHARLGQAATLLHSWAPALIGPASASPSAGEQEDSAFTRGEALLPGGVGCEIVTYLSALKLAARPCHHLEADGSQLDASRHQSPRLVLWDGRPHWHTGVSPDRLGKPTGIIDAHGWWGPDVEHAMFATLAAGARYTGSPALQHLLRAQAVIYPMQWTTTPGLSTSQPFAARAVGWEGILAVHLWRDIEDRVAAANVRAHYVQRSAMVLVPTLGAAAFDIWDVRDGDPRLGTGRRWIPWQQALGAYGADLAGEQFNLPALRAIALRAARRVLDDAWRQVAGRWVCCPSGLLAEPGGNGGTFDESFNHYGMPLAPCVVLRHEPTNAKARSILAQVRASATEPKHTRWIAPGVQ